MLGGFIFGFIVGSMIVIIAAVLYTDNQRGGTAI